MAGKKATKRGRRAKASQLEAGSTAKGKAWTFPKNTLEQAIAIPKALEEKNAGNPMAAADVAKAVGYRQPNDWRFLDLLRSANLYGIVDGSGQAATVSLQKNGQDIVAPGSPSPRSEALRKAFRNVAEFATVEKHYGGKRLPEDEFFLNTLTRQFKIPRDRVEQFSKVFVANLNFLNSFNPRMRQTESEDLRSPSEIASQPPAEPEARSREFLDTCFVMMPFGQWPDRYYKDLYIPAIKQAGFEPVRADELFNTGSVVEQIWEQIQKSKVLLADLSGKNPNVFYELGLAHAARKPVVFTSSQLDDVPFDLRHLRVIIYDVREPDWGTRLKQSVADYLKNAAREPDKSIPHPFRRLNDDSADSE